MKSQKKLESFSAYCKAYPEERFWQALRNWAGVCFIYTYMGNPLKALQEEELHDTFYDE